MYSPLMTSDIFHFINIKKLLSDDIKDKIKLLVKIVINEKYLYYSK